MSTEEERVALDEFCKTQFCHSCVFKGKPYRCGRGYYFDHKDYFGIYQMPDEEIHRQYLILHPEEEASLIDCLTT